MQKDLLENDAEDDDWVLVPSPEEGENVLNDEGGDSSKTSESNQQHLHSDTMKKEDDDEDALGRREDENIPKSPKSPLKRYNSPIFENLLPVPIEPVKLSLSPSSLSIPADNSIDNLLETASLVSKTTKTTSRNPMSDDEQTESTTNTEIEIENDNIVVVTNNIDDDANEIDNEWLSLGTLVAEKRPSAGDPELVLMQNVVPGERRERREFGNV